MSGYVFLSNSTKPSELDQKSRKPVGLTNVSRPCLQTALDMGYEVYFGTNRENPEGLECELSVNLYDSHTYRSVTAFRDNRIAYKNLCNIVKNGNVSVIHCNTPVGGLIGRLVGKRYHVAKVIYTVHGFHFYKGAPIFNCTLLKWAEKIMAHWTDAIITMNEEDYEAAQKFRLKKGGKVYYVPGVGIETEEYAKVSIDVKEKRRELSLLADDIVLISMGDLVPRKNYKAAIMAVAKVNDARLHYLICGSGPELDNLKALAESLNVSNQIHFLGFRSDIKELLRVADIFLFTTLQEGLPRSMMEAMASGLPCVASRIRGNVDLIKDGVGGYLCKATDADSFAQAIRNLAADPDRRTSMGAWNLLKIKDFDIDEVMKKISGIYGEVLA